MSSSGLTFHLFDRPREKHRDAQRSKGGGGSAFSGGDNYVMPISAARVVNQPGDGSCLFHSLTYGMGGDARSLRRDISTFIGEFTLLLLEKSSFLNL